MYMYLQNCVTTEMQWPINMAALIVLQRLLTKFTTTISLLKLQAEIVHVLTQTAENNIEPYYW